MPEALRRIKTALPREHVELAVEQYQAFAQLQQGMQATVNMPNELTSCLLANMSRSGLYSNAACATQQRAVCRVPCAVCRVPCAVCSEQWCA